MLVTGGGTGGHLFPAVAMAEAVLQGQPGSEVLFVGTSRHMDTATLSRLGFKTTAIRCQGLKGKGLSAKLRTLFELPLSILEARRVIRRFGPDLVFGVGGYVTGPVILAARLLGIATCIHEQNSVPGLANRLLGRIAEKIFVSIPGSERYFPSAKTILTGNPVRREILALAGSAPDNRETMTLLILGGSQGAHRVNTLVLEAIESMVASLPDNLRIIHQTGADDKETVQAAYARLGIKAWVLAFFQNMPEVYRQADVVISRAGATTLAELMVLGKPAILIPYPFAADNHQELNGRYLVENGAARMFRQADLTGGKLGNEIGVLLRDEKLRSVLAMNMKKLSRPAATAAIVREALALVH